MERSVGFARLATGGRGLTACRETGFAQPTELSATLSRRAVPRATLAIRSRFASIEELA